MGSWLIRGKPVHQHPRCETQPPSGGKYTVPSTYASRGHSRCVLKSRWLEEREKEKGMFIINVPETKIIQIYFKRDGN